MTRKVRPRVIGLLMILLLCIYTSQISYGQDTKADELYGEIGLNFYTGDYGTNTDTDTYTIPLTLGYSPDDCWDFYLTIPYLHQSTSTAVMVAGKPVRVKMDMTGGQSKITEQNINTTSHSGLGDICLGGSYLALTESAGVPAFYLLASIKFPTADEEKGLGTGEYDYCLGLGLEKKIQRWTLFGDVKYNIIGSPGGIDLDNFFSITAGASHQCTSNFTGSIYMYAAESASVESNSPVEASLSGEYALDRDNQILLYVSKGLSDGSPDYGLGIALSHCF